MTGEHTLSTKLETFLLDLKEEAAGIVRFFVRTTEKRINNEYSHSIYMSSKEQVQCHMIELKKSTCWLVPFINICIMPNEGKEKTKR